MKNICRITLHPKQSIAFSSTADEILYGGAAGGGKSFLLRVKAIVIALQNAGAQIYLFRRQFSDLVKNHLDGPGGFRVLLEPYLRSRDCRITTSPPAVRFRNGSVIHLCHCRLERDVMRYQGAEIHALLIDELTHFTETIYRSLRARCRVPADMTRHAKSKLPLILCGANPGGPGHNWVKRAFIDPAAPLAVRRMPPEEGGMLRQYIPAKLEDNPSLDKAEYESRLAGLKSPWLIRAMLEGSWDIVTGGMWDQLWEPSVHVVTCFALPRTWRLDRSFDWGSSKPYSVGFWAESDGSDVKMPDGSIRHTLRGDLFRFAEIYGWNGHPDEGVRQTPAEVAKLILETEKRMALHDRIKPGPADNSIFDSNGYASIASDMERAGIRWTRSDKSPGSRKRGWVLLAQRLKGAITRETPGIFIFAECRNFIRTIPVLERAGHDPDDIDTTSEDHIADETRYRILAAEHKPAVSGSVQGFF